MSRSSSALILVVGGTLVARELCTLAYTIMSLPLIMSPDSVQEVSYPIVSEPEPSSIAEPQSTPPSPHDDYRPQDSGSIMTDQSGFARNGGYSVRTSYDDLPASQSELGESVNGGSLYGRIIGSQSRAQVNEHGTSPSKVISCRICNG